jgi:hypothetical protein
LRRHPFETYLDKVFDFSAKVGALPDGRQSPRHHGKKIFDAVFLGAACQFPALHRIETECQRGALSKRIGSLSEDAIGYALERQDPSAVFALGCEIARQLKRNGLFRSDWSRGLVVAAVDGMEICSSFARSCDHCMERKVKHTVDGELREELQFYHRICAVTIVSSAFPIPLGMRFQKNGETEVSCTLSLLRDLLDRVGRRFFDLLVADALYLQAPFVGAVEDLGLHWVINLKENQPELLAEAQRLTAEPAPHRQSLARSGSLLARRRSQRPSSQNRPHATEESHTGRLKRCRAEATAERNGRRTKHQLLGQQPGVGHHPTCVRPSVRPQSLGHRHGSVSDHHYRRPPQKTIRASGPRPGVARAHHDSRSGVHLDPGVLSSPGSQPLQKLFHRFLRFGSETGVSIYCYSSAGFQLNPRYN